MPVGNIHVNHCSTPPSQLPKEGKIAEPLANRDARGVLALDLAQRIGASIRAGSTYMQEKDSLHAR